MTLRSLEGSAGGRDATASPQARASGASAGLPGENSLPELRRRDEARLLVQSPEMLFLYWSFARDPRERLRRALGDAAARYDLAVRLVETGSGRDRLHGAHGTQSLWLEARPGESYRADVGFYAAGLPFLRVLSSNEARTPPAQVSPVSDESAEFQTTARDFSPVLALGEDGAAAADAAQALALRGTTVGAVSAPSSYGWWLSARHS